MPDNEINWLKGCSKKIKQERQN